MTIGLGDAYQYYLRQFHPTEKLLGIYRKGESVPVSVPPFRSYMLIVSAEKFYEPGIIGSDYELIKDVGTEEIEIDILGMPGTSSYIQLEESDNYSLAVLDGEKATSLMKGRVVKIDFPGEALELPVHRKMGSPEECNIPRRCRSTLRSYSLRRR